MKNWKVSISDRKVDGLPQSGYFDGILSDVNSLEFVEADIKSRPTVPFRYLMIDTERWFDYWQMDPVYYIPSELKQLPIDRRTEAPDIKDKLKRLCNTISESKKIYSPSFKTFSKGMQIGISDGRHRIALIKKLGIQAFPAAVPLCAVEQLTRLQVLSKI